MFSPLLAKMVIKTCSFMLKGPGFRVNFQFVTGKVKTLVGSVAAISFPNGRVTIWAATVLTYRAFSRKPKNLFRNARSPQDSIPRTHVRNVNAGMSGSSWVDTISLTCSIGLSFSSSFSPWSSSKKKRKKRLNLLTFDKETRKTR